MRNKRLSREYYLVLLPLFFVLHGFTENFHLIGEKDALILLLQYLFAELLFAGLFFWLLRSWQKAALLVFGLFCWYFFFGSLHDAAKFVFHQRFIVQYSFILPFSVLLLIAAFVYLKKTSRAFPRFTLYINLLFVILIGIDVFQLAQKTVRQPAQNNALPPGFVNCDSCGKPDIYLIVADEYAGNRELKDLLGFDNSAFENELRQRGFFIADSATSNYNYTPFSLASLLSMNYLAGIEAHNKSKHDRQICNQLINRNALSDFLRSQGYAFKNLSAFEFNGELPPAPSPFILTGRQLLTSQTFLSRLDRDLSFNLITRYKMKNQMSRLADKSWQVIRYLMDETEKQAGTSSRQPRFIYTHLMMPHYPYLFDKNGNRTAPEMILEGTQINGKAFTEYLQFANTKFLALIDHILKNAAKPPVIIFMGDHGFRHFTKRIDPRYFFMNLNAVYLPGKNYDHFYNDMSPVNEFRVLLNTQFGQHLPLLKDSTVYIAE